MTIFDKLAGGDYVSTFRFGAPLGDAAAIKAKSDALASSPNLVELTKAEKWNGALPTTMVPDATLPFMRMN